MTDAEVEQCLADLLVADREAKSAAQWRDDLLGQLGAEGIEFKLTMVGASWKRTTTSAGDR